MNELLARARSRPLIYYWLPLIAWMGVIFWFSAQPRPIDLPSSWQEDLIGICGHLIGYAGLSLLWKRTLAAQWSASARRTSALAFLLTVLYAVSDEYHQTFVPGRDGTPVDLLIDAAGGGLGLWLLRCWHGRWSKGEGVM